MNNQNKILEALADLREQYDTAELEQLFVERAIDEHLAAIGGLYLGADKPDHVLAFTGYEMVKNSPYLLGK